MIQTAPWLLNVNIPNLPLEELKPIKVCRLGRRHSAEPVLSQVNPFGETMYWIGAAGPAKAPHGGAARRAGLHAALGVYGFDFAKQQPPLANVIGIVGVLLALGMLSALTYGSVAALLSEMFPPRIRYSSMSIPYHIGAGYLGGFLPLIAGVIVARTGDIYAGLWYTWVVVAFGLVVAWWGIPGGPPTDFADD